MRYKNPNQVLPDTVTIITKSELKELKDKARDFDTMMSVLRQIGDYATRTIIELKREGKVQP